MRANLRVKKAKIHLLINDSIDPRMLTLLIEVQRTVQTAYN